MNQSPGVGGYISVNRVVKAGLIKKGTVEQRLRGEGAWHVRGGGTVHAKAAQCECAGGDG